MACTVINLTTSALLLPLPLNTTVPAGGQVQSDHVAYDDLTNDQRYIDLIDRGIISVLNEDFPTQELVLKAVPVATDILEISDSAAAWQKKRATIGSVSGLVNHAANHRGGGIDEIAGATIALAGLMSAADKVVLDEVAGGQFFAEVRNETGAPLVKGTLVASQGWSSFHDIDLVFPADKDNPARLPCLGVVYADIPDATNGRILISGPLDHYDTTAFDPNDVLVLGTAGAFSKRPPGTPGFTGEIDIVGTVLNVSLADGIILMMAPLPSSVSGEQSYALQGTSGTPGNANRYVTDQDPRLDNPPRYFQVAASGGDYTSIKAAVDAAIAAGCSAANPYAIRVFPGTYTELPMSMVPGISLSSTFSTRMDAAFIVAQDPTQDLFTCTGGAINGFRVSGVTDPARAIFRVATPNTSFTLWGCSFKNCATGAAVSNGATLVASNCTVVVTGAGQGVGTVFSVTGVGSYLAMTNCSFSVPAAFLPLYLVNPIQTVVSARNSAEVYCTGSAFRVAPLDATADCIFADGGAFVSVVDCDGQLNGNFVHVGPVGANTEVVCNAVVLADNLLHIWNESATGVVFTSYTVDQQRYLGVPGAKRSGWIQFRDDDTLKVLGDFKYRFETDRDVDIKDYFEDYTATGVCDGGVVTDAGGLNVSVALGDGWIRRESEGDAFWVSWVAGPVVLDNNTTNYVVYDGVTLALKKELAPPGESAILLATVVTAAGDIRYLHSTRTNVAEIQTRMHEYLLATRRCMMKTGIAATVGGTVRKVTLSPGEYYLGLDPVAYAGAVDATFSYFYGVNGATEVPGSLLLDTTQYDNAGALALMTGGWYRADTLYITSDGRVAILYGTSQHLLEVDAVATTNASPPTFIEPSSFPVAKIIVQQGVGISSIVDIRPVSSTLAGAGGAVLSHSGLADLLALDHPQYLQVSGASPMTGNLDLDTHAVVNVTTVNGVSPTGHVARHQPGGLDALAVGVPVDVQVGAAPDAGLSANLSRADHLHGIGAAVPVSVGTANAEGAAGTVARSNHVHDHGNQIVGTHHAVATGATAGFMAAADKTVFDELAIGHTLFPVRNETGAPILRGTLVASTGWSVPHGCMLLVVADKDDGDKRPAIGCVYATIPDATNGQIMTTGVLDAFNTSAYAVTDQLVLGTAGAFSKPPPDVDPFTGEVQNVGSVVRVGVANGAIMLVPDGLNAITSQQIFALVGTNGAPSKINRYVTDSDPRNTNNRAPSAHAVNHTGLGGDVIANSTAADAGFMSAAQWTKLDGIATGATNTPLAITAPVDVTKAVAVIGGSTTAAKADHKHDVSTAVPGTVTFGVAAEGGATSLARSDHTHALTAPAAPTATNRSAADAGASGSVAREDHHHDVVVAVPGVVTFAAAPAEGASSSLARADHAHEVPLPGAPADVTKAAASAGASANFARQDHKHDVTTAVPVVGAVVIGGAATEGDATTVARSNHIHEVLAAVPVAVGTANAEGAAGTFSRSNHVHAGLSRVAGDFATFAVKANPMAADVVLLEDSAAVGAKKYATVGTLGPSALIASATVSLVTNPGLTDVLATGMTLTPAAGTWLVTFSGSITNATSGETTYVSIWYNGLQVASSERRWTRGTQAVTGGFTCQAIVTVSGALAVEGRWRTTNGTSGSLHQRTLTAVRVN
jgi:hypothetical protein